MHTHAHTRTHTHAHTRTHTHTHTHTGPRDRTTADVASGIIISVPGLTGKHIAALTSSGTLQQMPPGYLQPGMMETCTQSAPAIPPHHLQLQQSMMATDTTSVGVSNIPVSLRMWQSRVEIEHYSIAHFDCCTKFEMLYCKTSILLRVGLIRASKMFQVLVLL